MTLKQTPIPVPTESYCKEHRKRKRIRPLGWKSPHRSMNATNATDAHLKKSASVHAAVRSPWKNDTKSSMCQNALPDSGRLWKQRSPLPRDVCFGWTVPFRPRATLRMWSRILISGVFCFGAIWRLLLNGCCSASPSTFSICTIKSKTDAWEAIWRFHHLFLPVYNSFHLEFLMKIIPWVPFFLHSVFVCPKMLRKKALPLMACFSHFETAPFRKWKNSWISWFCYSSQVCLCQQAAAPS